MKIKKILEMVYWGMIAVAALAAARGHTGIAAGLGLIGILGIPMLAKHLKIDFKAKEKKMDEDEELEEI